MFHFDKTSQKEHYYEKNNEQETRNKNSVKLQNVNIAPHMLKQVMRLMRSLGLNKMEKDIVDVKIVRITYAYGKKRVMNNNKNIIKPIMKTIMKR
jgi:hypothetical protein